ncbi:Maf-like protein [Metschnikowia bicuspidata var. bicuspidata NRRL YB-4993]|uniref:Maf-like protein n=1 Tax=Metschnikowia bicuspidata var. bicuspidata NRRL YB-4993 TaxID=869754 RepID=A0A1A0HI93_9ASCO|nr:Maf-like protein [Metschnikowia bicuspidata var. bicuspidata NRRL YB-4993]OBA23889.1 Maf-like protein [Metschnikowia bicuspidata var. bicuspidata NRRL YB-4993]
MWSSDSLQQLQTYEFILGSSSPRRAEILNSNIGVTKYTIMTSSFEENLPKSKISDVEYVTSTAQHKIPSIISQLETSKDYVLLVADTIVSCGGKVFEKPVSPEDQWAMLSHYRNHFSDIRVITAVHVCRVSGGQIVCHEFGHEITALEFDAKLTDLQLHYYIATGEGSNVAGGFKYQEKGSMLFVGLSGDYFNVVGLPVKKTHSLLTKVL